MNSKELHEKIRERVFKTVSTIMQEKKKQSKYAAPQLSQEELDRVVFNGNSFEGIQKKFSLREAHDTLPQVTTSEIKEFENAMENVVSTIPNAIINFDVQPNGHYMNISMSPNGAEAQASGSISISNNGTLSWIFSLQEGFKFMVTEPMMVDQDNKNLITQLQDYYSAWQKEWREKLSKSKEETQASPEMPTPNPSAGGAQMGGGDASAEFGAANI